MKNVSLLLLLFVLINPNMTFAVKMPQRIVSTMPSITEMLFALDLGDRVVGVTTNCNYPPAAQKKEKIGGFFLNLEKVVSLKPDLVVMIEDAQKSEIDHFKHFGLPVMTINPKNVDGVLSSLTQLGKVSGQNWQADSLVSRLRQQIYSFQRGQKRGIESVLQRPKGLVIVGLNPIIVAGQGTFIDDIMQKAGVENLARKTTVAYPQYSLEILLNENPDLIIITQGLIKEKELLADRRWQKLSAVKNKRLLFIDQDVISRPGPRVVDAIAAIAGFVRR